MFRVDLCFVSVGVKKHKDLLGVGYPQIRTKAGFAPALPAKVVVFGNLRSLSGLPLFEQPRFQVTEEKAANYEKYKEDPLPAGH